MQQSSRQRKMLARTQGLMAVVSLIPLVVLLYISAEYVIEPLTLSGRTTAVYAIFAILACTVLVVVLGYVLVRRDTVRAIDAIGEGEARLDRLHQATGEVASQENPKSVQTSLVAQACELVAAERGAFWTPVRGELIALVAQGMSAERARNHTMPIGQGLVGRAVSEQRVVLNEELSQSDKTWDDRVRTRTHNSLVVPLMLGDDAVGVLDLRNKREGEFDGADQQLAEGLARQAVVFLANAAYRDTHDNQASNVDALVHDLTDDVLCWPGHSDNVRAMCEHLGGRLDLPDEQLDDLLQAALYHDIGLLDCDDPREGPIGGPPEHAEMGADRLDLSPLWADIAPIVRAHHERMDGEGPLGLRGFAIPMISRILALAEYIDTVTNPASPWGNKSVLDLVDELSDPDDRRFDRQVVEAFLADFEDKETGVDEATSAIAGPGDESPGNDSDESATDEPTSATEGEDDAPDPNDKPTARSSDATGSKPSTDSFEADDKEAVDVVDVGGDLPSTGPKYDGRDLAQELGDLIDDLEVNE